VSAARPSGEAVASAYGEFDDADSEKGGFLSKVAGIFEKNDGSDFTNISPGEMEALQQLKRALSVKVE